MSHFIVSMDFALADKHHGLGCLRMGVGEPDQPRWPRGALADGEDAAVAAGLQVGLVENLGRDSLAGGDPDGLFGQHGGRQVDRCGIDQVPDEVDGGGDYLAAPDRVGVAVAGEHRHGDVGRRSRPVPAEAVPAEQRPGGDGLRLGGRLRRQRHRDGLGFFVFIPNGRFAPTQVAQRRSGGAAKFLGVKRGIVLRRAAEPYRQDQRNGQLPAAGDLGELFGFSSRA
jgi:hypothetical protein